MKTRFSLFLCLVSSLFSVTTTADPQSRLFASGPVASAVSRAGHFSDARMQCRNDRCFAQDTISTYDPASRSNRVFLPESTARPLAWHLDDFSHRSPHFMERIEWGENRVYVPAGSGEVLICGSELPHQPREFDTSCAVFPAPPMAHQRGLTPYTPPSHSPQYRDPANDYADHGSEGARVYEEPMPTFGPQPNADYRVEPGTIRPIPVDDFAPNYPNYGAPYDSYPSPWNDMRYPYQPPSHPLANPNVRYSLPYEVPNENPEQPEGGYSLPGFIVPNPQPRYVLPYEVPNQNPGQPEEDHSLPGYGESNPQPRYVLPYEVPGQVPDGRDKDFALRGVEHSVPRADVPRHDPDQGLWAVPAQQNNN